MKKLIITITFLLLVFTGIQSIYASSPGDAYISSCGWSEPAKRKLEEIKKVAICACGMGIKGDKDAYNNEENLIDDDNKGRAITCTADIEKRLLMEKGNALIGGCNEGELPTGSNLSVCKIKSYKALDWGEQRRYAEMSAGLSCSNIDLNSNSDNSYGNSELSTDRPTDLAVCVTDIRAYQYYLTQLYTNSWTSAPKRWMYETMQSGVNGMISGLSFIAGISSFGLSYFDKLPELPFNSEDKFNSKSLIGIINLFSLAIIGFLTLLFLISKGADRQEDKYTTFFLKLGFILSVTIGFSFLYNGLNYIIDLFRDGFINALAKTEVDNTIAIGGKLSDVLEKGIRMQLFSVDGINSADLLTLLFFIPNAILLFLISFVILLRDIFLRFISFLFFLLSVGILIGSIRKDDIFESNTIFGSSARFLVMGMNFSLSLFISIVIKVILFMFVTVLFAILPGFPYYGENLPRAVENLNKFSIDTFLYLLLLGGTIYIWFKWIRPAVFGFVSDFVKSIFFRHTQGFNTINDFYGNIRESYSAIREGYESMRDTDLYQSIVQPHFDGLGTKWEHLRKTNRFAEVTANLLENPQLSNENSALRQTLGTVVALGTGTGNVEVGKIADKFFEPIYSDRIKMKRELSGIEGVIKKSEERLGTLDMSRTNHVLEANRIQDELIGLKSKKRELEKTLNPEGDKLRYKGKLKEIEDDIASLEENIRQAEVMNDEGKLNRLKSDLEKAEKAKEGINKYLSGKENSIDTDYTEDTLNPNIENGNIGQTEIRNYETDLDNITSQENKDLRKELSSSNNIFSSSENKEDTGIINESVIHENNNVEPVLVVPNTILSENIKNNKEVQDEEKIQQTIQKQQIIEDEKVDNIIEIQDELDINKKDLIEKFELYSQQENKDNLQIFRGNPLIDNIISTHFSEVGEIDGVGNKVMEYFNSEKIALREPTQINKED